MKKRTLFLMIAISATFISCKNAEKGKLITAEQFKSLNELEENDEQRFAVAGYPFIDDDIQVNALGGLDSQSQYPQIMFYEQPNGQGKPVGIFPIPNGTGKNEFNTPATFTMDDVVFYDNDGNPLKHTDKMEISFTMDLQTERSKTESNGKMIYYGNPIDVRIDKAK